MCKSAFLTLLALSIAGVCLVMPPALAIPGQGDPDDEQAYRAAVARQAFRENCLICHSEEMVVTQRLTPAQWKTEVEKMVGWGSPLPRDQVQPLIDYLSREYAEGTPAASLARMPYTEVAHLGAPQAVASKGNADRGAALYATHCASCHGREGQGADLGPNLVEKPVLLRPDDFHRITEKGLRRMPAFQRLLAGGQEDDIRAWLQTRRFELPAAPR
jgi:ubiquinol-cytochrome c reductase cytochrome c subunit